MRPFVALKDVAFESFIKIQFFFLKKISYLCGKPQKVSIDFKKDFSFMFNSFDKAKIWDIFSSFIFDFR